MDGSGRVGTDVSAALPTALRAADLDYRRLVEAAGEGIWVFDLQGRTLYANARMAEILACDAEELVGRPWTQFVASERLAEARRGLADMQRGVRRILELQLQRADGSGCWALFSGSAFSDDESRPLGTIAVVTDITARRHAEEDLYGLTRHARCSLWQGTVSALPGWDTPQALNPPATGDWHLVWDYTVQDDMAARQVCDVARAPGESYTAACCRSRFPEDNQRMRQRCIRAFQGGETSYSQEYRCRDRYGRVQWLYEAVSVEALSHGKWHVVGVVVNISERKQAEERLRQMTERRELLARISSELLGTSQPQQIIDCICRQVMAHLDCHLFLNYLLDEPTQRLRLTASAGLSAEMAAEMQWRDLGTGVSGRAATEGHRIVATSMQDQPALYSERARRLGLQAAVSFPLLSQGRVIGTLTFGTRSRTSFSDDELALLRAVTDQVALAIERTRLLEAAEQRAAEAAQASQAKDQFLAILSHELRTPLTPVLVTTTLLEQRGDLPADIHADLQTIRQSVELEARIIDDLLDLTRIARGKMQFDMRVMDLHQVARMAVEICQHGEGSPIMLDLQARSYCVHGDPTRLQQVFWNLLSNARKFTPAGGTITLRSRDGAQGICVEVADTGIGVDPAFLPRMFSAFEQSQETRARSRAGLGLGLAISKAIVQAHRGALRVHSAGRGKGTTFTLELPTVCAWPRAQDGGVAREAARKPGQALRILLVEDHPGTLKVMRRFVESLGHRVWTAETIAAALAAAQEQQEQQPHQENERHPPFDLLISDLGLPDGNGAELMRELRAQYGLQGIALSGYGMEEDLRRSREAGFAEHLIKPVDVKRLRATIERVSALGPNGR